MKINTKFSGIKTRSGLLPAINIVLFAIYPVLFLYAHNVEQVVLKQLVLPVLLSLLLSAVFFSVWIFILKNVHKAGLATVIFTILFWNYGLLYLGASRIPGLHHWHLIPLVLVIYGHLVWFITKAKKQQTLKNLTTIFLLPVSLLVIINIVIIFPVEVKKVNVENKYRHNLRPGMKTVAGTNFPDIYFIILDEFPNTEVVKQEFGYDNSTFTDYLKDQGFYIAEKSVTRYIYTEWVIASILNLEYVTPPVDKQLFLDFFMDPRKVADKEKLKMLESISPVDVAQKMNHNYVTAYLKERGYKVIVLEGYPTYKMDNADIFVSYMDIRQKKESVGLTDAFYLALYKKTMLFPFDMFSKIDQAYSINDFATRYIFQYLTTDMKEFKSPKFVYAHIMSPHAPFVFDREGNSRGPVYPPESNPPEYLTAKNNENGAYLDQYLYVCNQVEKIVTTIIKQHPGNPPVIIVQSDHGPRPHQVYLKDKANAFRVFNAIYFPDGDYRDLHQNIATVNTFRVVLNKYFEENLKLLEDN